jgi:hypothetical protein
MPFSLSILGGAGAQFFDDSGVPLAGGKINVYLAGTTTPTPSYTTSAGTTPNSNPIILNAAGRPPGQIWLDDAIVYKFVITDALDVLITTQDNLYGVAAA